MGPLANLTPPPALGRFARSLRATRLGAGLGLRGRLVLAAAGLSALARLAAPSPPERTAAGVAALLGHAAFGDVRPDDFVWEERGGFLVDEFWGRRVLFLAGAPGTRDLYRARVRITRGGRALSVAGLHDLSGTPRDDDRDLSARRDAVAVAISSTEGAVLGVRLLDLSGEGAAREAGASWARFRAGLESLLDTGSTRGVGVTEIAFASPPKMARFELTEGALVLALGEEGEPAALDLRTGVLNPGPRNPYGATAQRLPHSFRPFPRLLGDLARPTLGVRAASALEAVALRMGDFAAGFARVPPPAPWATAPAPSAGPGGWPPPPISSPASRATIADGRWHPAAAPVVEGALPFAYETAVSPGDGALIRLVAFDTRQVDFGLVAGVDWPRPRSGPRGLGRVPDVRPFVAAFDAPGPAPREADLGAVIEGRELVPLTPAAPTLALDPLGALHLGERGIPRGFESAPTLLQSSALLLGGGPLHQADCDDCSVERSALCITKSGAVTYGWSRRATAAKMRAALEAADCDAAIALSLRPAGIGLAFAPPPREGRTPEAEPRSRLVDPAMTLLLPAPGRPAAQPLFYVTLREPRPRAPLPAGIAWTPDSGSQPPPSWRPAVHEATVVSLGAQVHLTSFAAGRVSFRVRAGSKEIVSSRGGATLPTGLAEADSGRVLAAIGLSYGRRKGTRGLVVAGEIGLPLRGEGGLLLSDPGRTFVAISKSTEGELPKGVDATELPLTADDGKLLAAARELGSMRARAAACVLADGTFVIASTTFDSDEATTTSLVDLGCARVVALDRGNHAPAFVHRAGGAAAIEARYEPTVLYAIAEEMVGRATVSR